MSCLVMHLCIIMMMMVMLLMACDDAGWTDAVATETDCSPVEHVMQVQLQVSCKCTQHNE